MPTKPKVPDYGMYTKRGNAVMHGYVLAITNSPFTYMWSDVINDLVIMAKEPGMEKCMDTEVREILWQVLFQD
jgi:hypothetical protein